MRNNYWHKYYRDAVDNHPDDLLKQVGKTVSGKAVEAEQIDIIVNGIISSLQINKNDTVLDLCCGNGLLTERIARTTKKTVGMDYSEALVSIAKLHNSSTVDHYLVSDIQDIDISFLDEFDKFYMYEGMQHLSPPWFYLYFQNCMDYQNHSCSLSAGFQMPKDWKITMTQRKSWHFFMPVTPAASLTWANGGANRNYKKSSTSAC
jgi:2-polyprenyl-3-methyl-5-hydroxy-6-metoxy-1,4-benzoquinol methylase